ncbi:MAG: sigma-E factor negative regulatory protein [Gammaproteobacteria bacterium]|nr:sigma-E factor negative regulatory protein [Gammaproteobacteria bacterium]
MADKTAEQILLVRTASNATTPVDIIASQLSAMIDGELPDAEITLALRRLGRESDWQGRWERYHLISDTMQGHVPAALDAGFSTRIRQAIASEPLAPSIARSLPSWYKPVTGFALAASVVLVALFGFKLNQSSATLAPTASLTADISSPAIAATPTQAALTEPANDAGEPVETRLNSYLVNHNGYASRNSVNGMLPYVRMVGYQVNR